MNQPYSYDAGNPLTSPKGVEQQYKQFGFDPRGNNEASGSLMRFLPDYFEQAASNAEFGKRLNGQRQSAISALLNSLSPASQQSQMLGLQRGNTEQAANAARQANMMNRSYGLGDGFQAGTTAGAFGQADRMNNDIAREYASPQHQRSALQALLQAIGYGQENPQLDQIAHIGQILEQRHQANQAEMGSGSFLSALAPIAGAYLGGMGGGRAAVPRAVPVNQDFGEYDGGDGWMYGFNTGRFVTGPSNPYGS
ncbi:hypothetical protein [Fimbriimonas ginsengisoli]|uniref:Uncharacterized protein n=1 Tax=Fimbriimonas ginsengisoli Gsoil 348 TaxID=661478 RepID=A0A068NU73_FIMGI|nr:hypothetical protein [Fimbriimonas ginsengisoli]AIE86991.1 hypothetical protein OP10G_3623 [Fimbriimonas ginsengisoli Gsoil 348]